MNQIEIKFYIPPGNPSLKFEIQAGGGLAGSGGGGGSIEWIGLKSRTASVPFCPLASARAHWSDLSTGAAWRQKDKRGVAVHSWARQRVYFWWHWRHARVDRAVLSAFLFCTRTQCQWNSGIYTLRRNCTCLQAVLFSGINVCQISAPCPVCLSFFTFMTTFMDEVSQLFHSFVFIEIPPHVDFFKLCYMITDDNTELPLYVH